MNRNPLSPSVVALLRALRPASSAVLARCRSIEWAMLAFAGERVEIHWQCGDQATRDGAARLARDAKDLAIVLPSAILADLAVRLCGDLLIFEALVVAT